MNLNDLRSNLLYGLGTLLTGMLIAALLLAAPSVYGASISTEQYSFENLESPYDSSSYQYSFARDFIPLERSSLIDNLIRVREDCPKYVSVLEQFISCSPGLFDADLVSESNEPEQNRSTSVGQSS